MSDLDLQLLLPQGTTTYTGVKKDGFTSFTIDLIFSTPRFAEERLVCKVHDTDHGSDHSAIETFFALNQPILPRNVSRHSFKNVAWDKVRNKVSSNLALLTAIPNKLDLYSTQLVQVVELAIAKHVPLAKPSFYAKRWWTQSLTDLCKQYTSVRNHFHRSRNQNAPSGITKNLERQACAAKHLYFKE